MKPLSPDDLHAILMALADLLEGVGEQAWSAQARRALRYSDRNELRLGLRTWFGGMGSFTDLVLVPMEAPPDQYDALCAAQRRLEYLRSQLFQALYAGRLSQETK
jgi:hypothetical protein